MIQPRLHKQLFLDDLGYRDQVRPQAHAEQARQSRPRHAPRPLARPGVPAGAQSASMGPAPAGVGALVPVGIPRPRLPARHAGIVHALRHLHGRPAMGQAGAGTPRVERLQGQQHRPQRRRPSALPRPQGRARARPKPALQGPLLRPGQRPPPRGIARRAPVDDDRRSPDSRRRHVASDLRRAQRAVRRHGEALHEVGKVRLAVDERRLQRLDRAGADTPRGQDRRQQLPSQDPTDRGGPRLPHPADRRQGRLPGAGVRDDGHALRGALRRLPRAVQPGRRAAPRRAAITTASTRPSSPSPATCETGSASRTGTCFSASCPGTARSTTPRRFSPAAGPSSAKTWARSGSTTTPAASAPGATSTTSRTPSTSRTSTASPWRRSGWTASYPWTRRKRARWSRRRSSWTAACS